jgi:hypothetical protein
MRYVAAALAASRAVTPHEEQVSPEPTEAVEEAPVVKVARRRRIWRRIQPLDTWKPTHARP